ncbi:hypothetical protein K435DRAFT_847627 [Dendrothele bispora CBS 962.96]|uniref:Zn(2)-C6 fungal-type domain-containing protein n=1 Tax=Dendrothele bispora (strain CBS 962.96) TaxID=1314807 RepID=A0A4S8MYK6_DENBC|nr:hypothetical protein K435DRAFT_847627 [Dendrothele bispora CBS 962.96]
MEPVECQLTARLVFNAGKPSVGSQKDEGLFAAVVDCDNPIVTPQYFNIMPDEVTLQFGIVNPSKRRKKTSNACTRCNQSHSKCENARPCTRCIEHGWQNLCTDPHPEANSNSVVDSNTVNDAIQQPRHRSSSSIQPLPLSEETCSSHPYQASSSRHSSSPDSAGQDDIVLVDCHELYLFTPDDYPPLPLDFNTQFYPPSPDYNTNQYYDYSYLLASGVKHLIFD